MSARLMKLGTLASLALTIGGCTTLGGNVKGDFACRAPTSSCAPTSAIDEQATNAMQPQGANAPSLSPANGRTLRVVLAAWRDANGREHVEGAATVPSSLPQQLPDLLVIPSQGAPELPGASAPDQGAPGRSPSPGRVPHPVSPEGETR